MDRVSGHTGKCLIALARVEQPLSCMSHEVFVSLLHMLSVTLLDHGAQSRCARSSDPTLSVCVQDWPQCDEALMFHLPRDSLLLSPCTKAGNEQLRTCSSSSDTLDVWPAKPVTRLYTSTRSPTPLQHCQQSHVASFNSLSRQHVKTAGQLVLRQAPSCA